MDSNPHSAYSAHFRKWTPEVNDQLETELNKIEVLLKKKSETLEKSVTVLPSEETFPEETSPTVGSPLLKTAGRILSTLKRTTHAEDFILKENNHLKEQLKRQQYLLEEGEMERDVLLQQVHAYLETNSRLKVRLEEQRCQTGALQRQLNTDLELRIKSLESDKEKLIESNLEKDENIRKMTLTLERTLESFRNQETKVNNRKSEEINLLILLKSDLKKALDDKSKIEEKYLNLKERVEEYFYKRNIPEREVRSVRKRSLSVGDSTRGLFNFLEKNIKVEQDSFGTRETLKSPEGAWKLHASRSWPNGSPVLEDRAKGTFVNGPLNSLRRDLMQVTRKLEMLKIQLVNSGVIQEEAKPPKECRRLKRKGDPVDEPKGNASDEPKSEFKHLKHILQDAKNLNAKLQNLKEEKQRIIDSSGKTEGGVEVAEKENKFKLSTGVSQKGADLCYNKWAEEGEQTS